ncbi:MAG TPA: class I SAM-dependent methyltransferase [Ignavibacteriales bacterium]|nr:class I SAM-dependent methyltransferase [Ignavibacteriales bacterium]
METIQINSAKSEALVNKIMLTANYGALALMISIGHRTGLFDVMSRIDSFATIPEISNKAGLNERYVKEWLGAITVAGIVEHDPAANSYYFPPMHAAVLTRGAGTDNMAIAMQYIALLGGVEDQIVNCFYEGGGVPYSEFKRFHEIMAEESELTVVASLDNLILPLIPGIQDQMQRGIKVLDVGCGRGKALRYLAQAYPSSSFLGYDLSDEAIAYAKLEAEKIGLANLRFEQKDITNFDINEKFDLITAFDAVHDQARPDNVLRGIYRALNDDGVFLMQDIAASSHHHNNLEHPLGIFMYAISTMHCMTVSLAQGGMGLGTMWGRETALRMLAEAGFKNVQIKTLEHDIQNEYYIVRKEINNI